LELGEKADKMKYALALLMLIYLSTTAVAQTQSKVEESRGMRALIEPPVSQDRFIFELQTGMFLAPVAGMEIRPWSPGLNAYIMYDYQLGKSPISFAWGYGFSSFNIHINGRFIEDTLQTGFVNFQPFSDDYSWKKNKISVNFLEIPIEFRLRTRTQSIFKISLGGKFGYAVNIHTKTVDDEGKRKFYQVPELNRFRYGLTARIGVGRFSAYGFYSLSPFLKHNRGTELTPVAIGLTIQLL
jgi:hypothetical protein